MAIALIAAWGMMFLIALLSALLTPSRQNGGLKFVCFLPAVLIFVSDFYYLLRDLDMYTGVFFQYRGTEFFISVAINMIEVLALLFTGMWLASVKKVPQYGENPYMNM